MYRTVKVLLKMHLLPVQRRAQTTFVGLLTLVPRVGSSRVFLSIGGKRRTDDDVVLVIFPHQTVDHGTIHAGGASSSFKVKKHVCARTKHPAAVEYAGDFLWLVDLRVLYIESRAAQNTQRGHLPP